MCDITRYSTCAGAEYSGKKGEGLNDWLGKAGSGKRPRSIPFPGIEVGPLQQRRCLHDIIPGKDSRDGPPPDWAIFSCKLQLNAEALSCGEDVTSSDVVEQM